MDTCVRCAQENQATGVLEMECVKMALKAVESASAKKATTALPVRCASQGDMEPTANQVTITRMEGVGEGETCSLASEGLPGSPPVC